MVELFKDPAVVPFTCVMGHSHRLRGFTLVELMSVVCIVGVLAVLATYSVRRYITYSKTTEAKNSLGQISKDAAAAFEKDSSTSTLVVKGSSSGTLRALCGSTTTVPATVPGSRKYQSTRADWTSASTRQGWSCLKFSMEQPQYYSYQYAASNTTTTAGTYVAHAWGNLNGDATTSHFWVTGFVQNGQLTTSPSVSETNPEE